MNSCPYTVVFLLVELVWCCRKQPQERGIESLGGALRKSPSPQLLPVAKNTQLGPFMVDRDMWGHGTQQGTRTLPSLWPRGMPQPMPTSTLRAGTESSLRASSLQAISTQGTGQSFSLTFSSLNTFSPWIPPPSFISHPRRRNFAGLQLLLVSYSFWLELSTKNKY